MANKKVYLAVCPTASGLDVEYVKSSLLRIDGIKLVEFGMGIPVEKCACVVLIPDANFTPSEEDDSPLSLNRNMYNLIEDFTEKHESASFSEVYVYTKKGSGFDNNDTEQLTPMCLMGDTLIFVDDSFEKCGDLYIEPFCEENSLLSYVAQDIQKDNSYRGVPLHYRPEDKFAVPKISQEDRIMRKSSESYKVVVETFTTSIPSQHLLLRRRR